ncbi:MAG: glycosyltransferase family 1 protein [Planctomycetota bacterium]|nr:MAG: glycosyltransferase family 1 protein [Planctomycetota bacterium]
MNDSSRPEPLRIYCAAHSAEPGGAEWCLDTFLQGFDRTRFDVSVGFAAEGPMVARAQAAGCRVEIPYFSWWLGYERSWWYWKNLLGRGLFRIRRLARTLRREKVRAVYTNSAVVFEAALAARRARVPHVWHVHEVLTPNYWPTRLLSLPAIRRRIGRWSVRVVFESQAARKAAPEVPSEKVAVVPNPVRFSRDAVPSPEQARAAGQAFRRRHGIPLDKTLILWLGRFSERKDPLAALEAFRRVNGDEAVLVFAGEGPLETVLRERISESGSSNRVFALPFVHDVREALAAADALLLTSREESFGLVLVEAGAMAKPVVATATQGPREIVSHDRTGLLVPPGDLGALVGALQRVIADSALRARLGAAAQEHVWAEYDPALYVERLQSLLESAASGGLP